MGGISSQLDEFGDDMEYDDGELLGSFEGDYSALAAHVLGFPQDAWSRPLRNVDRQTVSSYIRDKEEIVLDLRRFASEPEKQARIIQLITRTAGDAKTVVIVFNNEWDACMCFSNVVYGQNEETIFNRPEYENDRFPQSVDRLIVVHAAGDVQGPSRLWRGDWDFENEDENDFWIECWTRDQMLMRRDLENGRVKSATVNEIVLPLTDIAIRTVLSHVPRGSKKMRVWLNVNLTFEDDAEEYYSEDNTLRLDEDEDDENAIVALGGVCFDRNPSGKSYVGRVPPIVGNFIE